MATSLSVVAGGGQAPGWCRSPHTRSLVHAGYRRPVHSCSPWPCPRAPRGPRPILRLTLPLVKEQDRNGVWGLPGRGTGCHGARLCVVRVLDADSRERKQLSSAARYTRRLPRQLKPGSWIEEHYSGGAPYARPIAPAGGRNGSVGPDGQHDGRRVRGLLMKRGCASRSRHPTTPRLVVHTFGKR
jgi:hypothetical protein